MGWRRWSGVAIAMSAGALSATALVDQPGPVPLCDGVAATLVGTDEADRLIGTRGADVIVALGGADHIRGRGGDDLICGGSGRDVIRGGRGSDRVFGGPNSDDVRGGPGNDELWGGSGNDRLHGGVGADAIFGGDHADRIHGVGGDDSLDGERGADSIWGGGGADSMVGGEGPDRLLGGSGPDTITGGPEADVLDGGPGEDSLTGGAGANRCVRGESGACNAPIVPPEVSIPLVESPNIVLINLDDADVDLLADWALDSYLPNIRRFFGEQGIRLANFHSIAPLCGPSRASLFRGQYPHNTGVTQNALGWKIFHDRGYTDDEIGAWMRDAGYATALVGKYCHEEYPIASRDGSYVPPGWDTFHASLGGSYFGTLRIVDGDRRPELTSVYRTDAERDSAQTVILNHDPAMPLFLYLAPFAPHGTRDPRGMVADRHQTAFSGIVVPRTPDYNEADVSDKTPQFASLPALTADDVDRLDANYRDRVRAMLAVDDLVGQLFADLEARDMLDTTYVILTSDNGYQLGHHRDLHKKDPFDRVTRVQAFVRGPGLPQGVTMNHLVGHIDLVPTILELAGVGPQPYVDGKSFVPLLERGAAIDATDWQDAILIENTEGKVVRGVELDLEYVALRRYSDVYVEWANGDREYYDMESDPYQLQNRWSELSLAFRADLAAELDALRDCEGPVCHGGNLDSPWPDTAMAVTPDQVLSAEEVIIGSASGFGDDIAQVEIVVRRVADRTYWNGDTFVPDYTTVFGALGGEGDTKEWELDANLPGGEYWISARAVDEHGDRDPLIPTTFFSVG